MLCASLVLLLAGCGGESSNVMDPEPTAVNPTSPPSPVDVTPTVAVSAPTAVSAGAEQVMETSTPTTVAPVAQPDPTLTPVPTAVPSTPTVVDQSPEPQFDLGAIEATIAGHLAGIDGHVAVVLAAADGTILYDLNGAESMEAASLYKLPIMVEIFRQFGTGEIDPDDAVLITASYFAEGDDSIGFGAVDAYVSIETLLFAMIAQSSNVAAYALLDLVGNDNVNATMAGLGLDGIEVRWSPRYVPPAEIFPEVFDETEEYIEEVLEPDEDVEDNEEPHVEEDDGQPADDEELDEETDEQPSGKADPNADWLGLSGSSIAPTLRADAAFNVVTAAGVAGMLVQVLNGEAVSEGASREMLELLAQQQIPGGLAGQLPAGVVAHKTGYLEDGVVNDAGIISTPAGAFVAVVLTEGVREDLAYQLMSDIGRLLWELGSE